MLTPGKNYYGSPMRVETCFEDSAGTLVDPATVTLKTLSPTGVKTTYVYLTDSELGRSSTGVYYCDFTPSESGRWHYRWESTGVGTAVADEDSFLVQYSPFHYGRETAYSG